MKILTMDLHYPNKNYRDNSILMVIESGVVKEVTCIKPFDTIVGFQTELQKHLDYFKLKYPGIKILEEKG